MVGEFSEFVEGGYRVLRVDAFEFGIFRRGDRLLAYENHCPHDGGPVLPGQGDSARRGGAGSGSNQPRTALLEEAEHRLSVARLGGSTSRPDAIAAIRNIACVRST